MEAKLESLGQRGIHSFEIWSKLKLHCWWRCSILILPHLLIYAPYLRTTLNSDLSKLYSDVSDNNHRPCTMVNPSAPTWLQACGVISCDWSHPPNPVCRDPAGWKRPQGLQHHVCIIDETDGWCTEGNRDSLCARLEGLLREYLTSKEKLVSILK